MDDLLKLLGLQIKEYRKSKNLKQSELAEKIGVDSKYLSRLETGLSTPSLKTIEKIAEVFNIEISTLFEFEKSENKEEIKQKIQTKMKNYSSRQLQILLSFSKFIDRNCMT